MAKRFTDTNKYRKPFIRGLKGAYKVLWDYLYHDCDHAGIWIVDFEVAQIYIGSDLPVNKQDALKYFNESEVRVVEIEGGKKWFLPSFIDFQYGELNPENRAHKSAIKILNNYNLINVNKGLIRGLQAPKDKYKDKDKDKDKDKPGKKKEEEKNIPTLDEFLKYALSHMGTLDRKIVELKYNAWVVDDWKDGYGNPIRNWKSKLLNTIPHLKEKSPQDNTPKTKKLPYL